ncbi:hypothetical protein GGR57DRAFT_487613 [Xylariaceae sp. FL1272]|nr:hypothetical protein GGR57DRAFT_487613 [Xylariaceae sp. FL1272]
MSQSAVAVPPDAWDTHIHVFDPVNFPYGIPRSYTPKAAALEEYPHEQTGCSKILVVQATVQGHSPGPLLATLATKSRAASCTTVRGLATIDPLQTSDAELDSLHAAGVRGVRLHEVSWGHGDQSGPTVIANKIVAIAPRIARLHWIIDVFTNVHTWALLSDTIRTSVDPRVRIVADHLCGAFPGDEALPEFQTVLDLVKDGLLYVKLSGFERLYHGTEASMDGLESITKAIVSANGRRILYGSDWPHTQLGVSRQGKSDEQRLNEIEGFREVPDRLHIGKLREWIPDEDTWRHLWVTNATDLFE